MYYIRKFEKRYWHQHNYLDTNKISAEAVTRNLTAKNNTLSFWRATDVQNIDEDNGLLALFGSMDSFDAVDIIIFDDSEFNMLELKFEDNLGDTRIVSFKALHTDLINLDLESLSYFAHFFARKVFEEEAIKQQIEQTMALLKKDTDTHELETNLTKIRVKKYSKAKIKNIIKTAITKGIIQVTDLSESFQRNIGPL